MAVSLLPHSVLQTKTVSESVNVVTVFMAVSLLPHSVPQTENMSELVNVVTVFMAVCHSYLILYPRLR